MLKSSVFDAAGHAVPVPGLRASEQPTTSLLKLPAISDKKPLRSNQESNLQRPKLEAPRQDSGRRTRARSFSPKQLSRDDADLMPTVAVKNKRLEERSSLQHRAAQIVDAASREARDPQVRRFFATEEARPEAEQEKKRRNKKVVDLHKYVKSKFKLVR